MKSKTRVIVVDDSALVRSLLEGFAKFWHAQILGAP